MTLQPTASTPMTAAAHDKTLRFVDALKRLNAKERNFLMRYVLADRLSDGFVNDLVAHLQKVGVSGLEGAQAVYFGMDYHLEWIHAALLLAVGTLSLDDQGKSVPRVGGQTGRIEDVDLLVVLEKSDGMLVLVLIEAKGVTAFDTSQITSKVARLLQLQTAMAPAGAPAFDAAAVHATRDWLEPIVLLMFPDISKPTSANCALFTEELARVGFWPKSGNDRSLVWMNLKGFFSDLGEPPNSLRITTSYSTGDRATNLAARSDTPYDHWRIERRTFAKKKE